MSLNWNTLQDCMLKSVGSGLVLIIILVSVLSGIYQLHVILVQHCVS